MASTHGPLVLSNELWLEILDHIEGDPDKAVGVDTRAYLSQESFRPPSVPALDRMRDISNLRLTCKRLAEVGAKHQFSRVTTRFSRKGLQRLESIAGQPHLSQHVKKFSYMVPHFYTQGRERVHELLSSSPAILGALDVSHLVQKVTEQREILSSQEDVRVLRKALSAFTMLQHVQILRVQDQEDGLLISYIRHHQESTRLVDLNWAPACSHSTKTLVTALLASDSKCSRFSSPMLTPQSAVVLIERPGRSLSTLAERLTCLELHFDDGGDLDGKMRELSNVFKTVFTAAKNMQAVHVGFPSHRPLSLRLEEVFHNIRWEQLRAFGIQSWRLDASEIITLARRHREKLKGLRLRDVLLREGNLWKDVLAFLRDEMRNLDWVSLRRIGYEKHFDGLWAMGAEVPDDPPGGGSDSSDESDSDTWDPHAESPATLIEEHYDDSDFGSSDSHSDAGTEEGAAGDAGMGFPPLSPDTPASVQWCSCDGRDSYPTSAEDLGDDGIFVSNIKRKMWEKWVIRRCPLHTGK